MVNINNEMNYFIRVYFFNFQSDYFKFSKNQFLLNAKINTNGGHTEEKCIYRIRNAYYEFVILL